ncbi:MAG: hypothetical protein WAZ14_00045 [Patescibacteria group bacterium]
MPTVKKTTSVRARKAVAVKPIPSVPGVCRSCHALPAGSMELMALMLVLVFSLTAVLFTSVYALDIQSSKIDALESQLAHSQLE